jgi:hypothetical protein
MRAFGRPASRKLPRSPPVVRCASSINTNMFLRVLRLAGMSRNLWIIVTTILVEQPVQSCDAIRVLHVCHAKRGKILEHLIFQLVAVDHQKDSRFLRFVRFEQKLRRLDHRIGFTTPLRMPHKAA